VRYPRVWFVFLPFASLLLALVLSVRSRAGEPRWLTATPESEGFDKAKLDAARDVLAARNTTGFLVIRQNRIVYEWYAADSGPDKPHYTASMAKALVGGMSLMLALNDGRIAVDDAVSKYIPAWKGDPQKSKITIRHLATHSSGIEDAEQDEIPHMELPGWKGRFWRKDPDPFTPAIHDAPVIFEPGSDYAYSNTGMAALSYAVTASLRGTKYPDVRALLRERILRPIGASDNEWSIGYGETYNVDGLPLVANWGGGNFTARAVARVGRLMLQRGNWDGRQLVDPGWVDRVTAYAGMPLAPRPPGNPQPPSGLGWWLNSDGVWPRVPRDAFSGAGAGQQVLLVAPSLELIIVRNGGAMSAPSEPEKFWGGIEKYVFNPVLDALNGYSPETGLRAAAPYPPSRVIRGVKFAPKSEIVRRAEGSDNWPLTWADDGNLYAAYGDGWGFEPRVPQKLSLGFARIGGGPYHFEAVNIRTASGEQTGQGEAGKKASGMLAVDGRLYLWARNAGNSQLAWSDDHGATWSWAPWTFTTSFGHPTFLNFGANYSGARDDYVYVYSHDQPSAYQPADRMVLARVPKDRLTDRGAYEFLGAVEGNQPYWVRHIEERTAVFYHRGRCYRSSISYHAPTKRYLWVQVLPGEAPRFHGGFGIYDAPEPWGPWTTVFFTENWDVGPGENAHLPTKWMSADGHTAYLVFSGDDSFSVRKVEFELADSHR
jgi:CubicO group peptidase (beta-lactamase class C family)